MKIATFCNAGLLAALALIAPGTALAQGNPPSGGPVECTVANGFEPGRNYHSCAHYFLEHIEEFDAEKIVMSSAHLGSSELFAALIFDAPDQQAGMLRLIMTSSNELSRMHVARGRWPSEGIHDCIAVGNWTCAADLPDPRGRPLHLLVRGDDSETTVLGYWNGL